MWFLTVGEILAALGGGGGLALLLDIPAFFIAVSLLFSRNDSDRANGKAKLFLELIGFVLAFFASAHR